MHSVSYFVRLYQKWDVLTNVSRGVPYGEITGNTCFMKTTGKQFVKKYIRVCVQECYK